MNIISDSDSDSELSVISSSSSSSDDQPLAQTRNLRSSNSKPQSSANSGISSSPRAKACGRCRSRNVQCSSAKDRKYPCRTCDEKGWDCFPYNSKDPDTRACITCLMRASGCSMMVQGSSEPCIQCTRRLCPSKCSRSIVPSRYQQTRNKSAQVSKWKTQRSPGINANSQSEEEDDDAPHDSEPEDLEDARHDDSEKVISPLEEEEPSPDSQAVRGTERKSVSRQTRNKAGLSYTECVRKKIACDLPQIGLPPCTRCRYSELDHDRLDSTCISQIGQAIVNGQMRYAELMAQREQQTQFGGQSEPQPFTNNSLPTVDDYALGNDHLANVSYWSIDNEEVATGLASPDRMRNIGDSIYGATPQRAEGLPSAWTSTLVPQPDDQGGSSDSFEQVQASISSGTVYTDIMTMSNNHTASSFFDTNTVISNVNLIHGQNTRKADELPSSLSNLYTSGLDLLMDQVRHLEKRMSDVIQERSDLSESFSQLNNEDRRIKEEMTVLKNDWRQVIQKRESLKEAYLSNKEKKEWSIRVMDEKKQLNERLREEADLLQSQLQEIQTKINAVRGYE